MKRKLLIILVTLCAIPAMAQLQRGLGFGAKVGVNISDFTSSTGGTRSGLNAGLFTDYYFNNTLGLELNAAYSQFGSIGNAPSRPNEDKLKMNYNFDYINLDLLFKVHFIDGFRIFAGPQVGFLVNGSVSTNDVATKLSNVSNTQFAIVAGVGYTFKFGLDLQASYTRGIQKVFTDRKAYNYAYAVTVGWRFIGDGGRARSFKQF